MHVFAFICVRMCARTRVCFKMSKTVPVCNMHFCALVQTAMYGSKSVYAYTGRHGQGIWLLCDAW